MVLSFELWQANLLRQSEFGVLHFWKTPLTSRRLSFTESIQAAEASVEPIRQEAHYAKDRPTALRRNGDLVREVPAIFADLQWWISSHNRFFCGYFSVVDIWGFPFRVSVLRITSHVKRSLFCWSISVCFTTGFQDGLCTAALYCSQGSPAPKAGVFVGDCDPGEGPDSRECDLPPIVSVWYTSTCPWHTCHVHDRHHRHSWSIVFMWHQERGCLLSQDILWSNRWGTFRVVMLE